MSRQRRFSIERKFSLSRLWGLIKQRRITKSGFSEALLGRVASIVIITWNFPPRRGGIENLMDRLCREIKAKRPVYVITSFADSSQYCGEDWVYRPRFPGLVFFFLYALGKAGFLLGRDRGIKFVLGGSALVIPLVVLLAWIFRCKAIVNVHGLDLLHPGILYQALCVRWIRYCDCVIANSHYTAFLAEKRGARQGSVSVIPPCVDAAASVCPGRDTIKREVGLDGKKVLLFVGRLVRRKGISEFLQKCFPRIRAQVSEICFVIVGENPVESLIHGEDMLGELSEVVRKMQLENQVQLLGWLDNARLDRLYQAADLLILPAISMETDVEGFAIVILEAAAAGKPCVATRVGGIPDAVEDSKSGILVEPGDYDAMARAVVDLLRDDGLRLTMGENAQRRVKEKFDWAKISQRYEDLFEVRD